MKIKCFFCKLIVNFLFSCISLLCRLSSKISKRKGVFYHSTGFKQWKAIRKEGILWGVHGHGEWDERNKCKRDDGSYRHTYLSPRPFLNGYGSVILGVVFPPKQEDFGVVHNYGLDPSSGEECWQFSVFKPIPLSDIHFCFRFSVIAYFMNFIFRVLIRLGAGGSISL